MEYLQDLHPVLLGTAVALVGLVVGSFLNVVILRLPPRLFHEWQDQCRELLEIEGETEPEPPGLVFTRSHCPKCGATIAWYDNIPVLSWLVLRARCRHCDAGISVRYPLVEALTAILSVAVIGMLGPTPAGLAGLLFTWVLIAGAGIDLDHKLLPDQLTLPLLWLGLLLSVVVPGGLFVPPVSAILGAAVGYLSLWSVYWAFKLLTGKEGMGYGDFKLLAALGAWCGVSAVLPIVLISSVVGAVIGSAWLMIKGRDKATPIPFGPYLAIAGWIVLVLQFDLLGAYARWVGMA